MAETSPSSSLLDLVSNSLILDGLLPHLPLASLFALGRTSKLFRDNILRQPSAFRYVDLSLCRGAYVPPITRIDSGGHSWRAERMDENLTEDEFYAGPLRGVFYKLSRMHVLKTIHTLVLDGLASVTHDLVSDIVTSSDFDIRLLSIKRCSNVNQSKLQQLLCYICRPSRPEGTPRLQGLYFFGGSNVWLPAPNHSAGNGITITDGAQLGAMPTDKVTYRNASEAWYAPAGVVVAQGHAQRTTWEETLQVCKGIICFDAVLCTHMHSAMVPVLHEASRDYLDKNKPGVAPFATIALGPGGCSGCGKAPEGAPVWGQTDYHEFPLLWPPPLSGRAIDAVSPPPRESDPDGRPQPQRLIVSCNWCVLNRHCDSCHRWWCGDCYNPKKSKKMRDLESLGHAGLDYLPARSELDGGAQGDNIKVFHGLCVENCLVGEWMAGAGGGGMWG